MKCRLVFTGLLAVLLAGRMPLGAQMGGPPVVPPPPVPGLEAFQAAVPLTDAQRVQIAPLLEEAAAARERLVAVQARLAQLREALPSTLAPVLTDSQKEGLPRALAAARFGRGPRGAAPPSPETPVPRTDPNSLAAHQQLLAKRSQGRIDVYFLGDSITRRWGATDYPKFLAHWNSTFRGWNAANFGWGGDTLQNMLWRLEEGELDGVHPKVIVFMGGTNNIGSRPGNEAQADAIVRGIRAVVDRLQRKAPDAVILLADILPRGTDPALHAFIRKINDSAAGMADGSKVRPLKLFPRFLEDDGRLKAEAFEPDQLHLAAPGYAIWADALVPVLTELLGSRAADDHAPPPSGDPSARK